MTLLSQHSPSGPAHWVKDDIKKETKALLEELYEYTRRLYAEGERSILLVLQGMDASGKDGLTRSLFKLASPAWVDVHSFKKPSALEAEHHFLWRIQQRVPKKGMIGVFNRSHYEDILVPSVYGHIDDEVVESRYEAINHFEQYLERNGTRVIKCYLNLSHEKQKEKLLERVQRAEKHWKHSDGDWETREYWQRFMEVYETLFSRCNHVPWNIIPCDKNWTKLYTVATILLAELKQIDPSYPSLSSERFGRESS